VARLAEPAIAEADEVVFSYHGLPERQVRAMDSACLQATNCCDRPDAALGYCYRAQCIASTRLIAAELGISDPVNAFQSRLGREPWLGPSLDETLDRLLAAGRRKIVVLTPSFVADCLETLEEIGIRARERVEAAGGSLHLVPCVNASPSWVETLARAVQSATGLA
jgi:ferrochelatase